MSRRNDQSKKAEREFQILKFIQENNDCIFGEIKEHLEKEKESYKNNKGLAKKLEVLLDENKIKKDEKAKPYPTYGTIKDKSLNTAIMGELFRENASRLFTLNFKVDDYFKNEINVNNENSFEGKFVKEMIFRYGFFMLSALVKGYDQSISKKGFNREIWMNHAIDLLKDEEMLSSPFLHLLFPKKDIDFTKIKNKPILKKKLNSLKQTMKESYPKLHGIALQHYENSIEGQTNKIKGLRKYPKIMQNVNF